MSLLQYTSKEMFSSTELIRKSKKIYEKLNSKEIEKAIILRDGKPSFMLLNFETYEIIMNEYLSMKGTSSLLEKKKNVKKTIKVDKKPTYEKNELILNNEIIKIEQTMDIKEDKQINISKEPFLQTIEVKKLREVRRKSLASNQDALKEVLSNMGKPKEEEEEIKNGTIRQKLKEFWD